MQAINTIEGTMVPMGRHDVDTDQIMPKQFLKRVERTGFGEFLFHDWRQEPGFILNEPEYKDGTVLLSGVNFGSGSSREHAPWGLQQYGFKAVIAESFSDIFRSNCTQIGLLCVQVGTQDMDRLMNVAKTNPATTCHIDLPNQQVTAGDITIRFDFDPFAKHMLVNGLDPIGLTLEHLETIKRFEENRPSYMPVTGGKR